jgi:hypothetical protein
MRSILEEETAIELQHINVKLLLVAPNLDPIIPIFHDWIQTQVFNNQELPELLIDVADYRHVHHGPGLVLIGHEADYSIDNTDGRLGLRYNRKAQLTGTNEEKLTQAARAAIAAAKRLQEDTRLNGKFHFNGHDIELFINDRLIVPNSGAPNNPNNNNEDARRALDLDIRRFVNKLLNRSEYSLDYETDPRRLFGAAIHTKEEFSVEELLRNLE